MSENDVRERIRQTVWPDSPAGGLTAEQALLGNVFDSQCPSRAILDHVTSKWGVLVLVALEAESLRWGELRRSIDGISEKMLAQTLKLLEADGFVHRAAQPVIPPRVDYSLTPLGHELAVHLVPLLRWVGTNAGRVIEHQAAGAA